MTSIIHPVSWVEYDRYKDTVVFSRPSHLINQVDLVVFKRTVASSGAVTGKYSVKWVRGVPSTFSDTYTANATYPNTLLEFSVRHVEGELDTDISGMLAEFATLLADPGMIQSITTTSNLPS